MRFSLALVAATVAAACVPVHAQFQPPTQEELQMTSEPKAPGASAIYLYKEEKADDSLHYHSFTARIKVLTEKGKELATVEIPYNAAGYKITNVQGRTIHPDGTIIPLNVRPDDLVAVKGEGVQINKKVFTLPSVEVGSILEYRWELRYDDNWAVPPDWKIQGPYYIRKAHYSFVPFKNEAGLNDSHGNYANRLMYTWQLPPNEKVTRDTKANYSLDVADVLASPDEDFMPPLSSVLEHVSF